MEQSICNRIEIMFDEMQKFGYLREFKKGRIYNPELLDYATAGTMIREDDVGVWVGNKLLRVPISVFVTKDIDTAVELWIQRLCDA